MKQLLYGLLDGEGKVIRWTECKPSHYSYVEKIIKHECKKRVSMYEMAVRLCGYADF